MANDRVLNAVLVVVAACAVALTAIALTRTRAPATESTREVSNWAEVAGTGRRFGAKDPRVTVVVFSDYQCPFCASFAFILDSLLERHPDALSIVHRHWPLDNIHPHARAAAYAAECAGRQDRFPQISRQFYRMQDSIGTRPWATFALDAGVSDTVTFSRCLRDPTVAAEILRDEAAVRSLGGRGTPTVLVDGVLFAAPPSMAELASRLQRGVR